MASLVPLPHPHPLSLSLSQRVTCAGALTATSLLRHGLQELSASCSHLDDAFDAACAAFDDAHMDS
jgi:DNA-directed RNA polymerase subunit L